MDEQAHINNPSLLFLTAWELNDNDNADEDKCNDNDNDNDDDKISLLFFYWFFSQKLKQFGRKHSQCLIKKLILINSQHLKLSSLLR